MLKDRSELEILLIEIFTNNISTKLGMNLHQEWCLKLSEKYNIPIGMASDYISRRKDLSECNEFVLFAITDVVKPDKIETYYTPTEIKMYSDKKLKLKTLKFPIKLKMIQITKDQFIGKTSAQFLMQLREKQLINYNQETQRALKVQIRGGEKILRPFVDSRAVNSITEMYEDNSFIPNAITLNINFDDEKADWYYDENTMEFVLKDITAFDIVDGYHRYLGMGRAYDKNNKWDYPMVLQITAFSEGKARQMIYQENQKTIMKETELESYNQNNAGNLVVDRINKDSRSNLYGQIDTNSGLIDYSVLSDTINRLWFQKDAQRVETIVLSKELMQSLNLLTESITETLKIKWQPYEIMVVMYGFRFEHSIDEIMKALENVSEEQKELMNRHKKIDGRVFNALLEVYGEDE